MRNYLSDLLQILHTTFLEALDVNFGVTVPRTTFGLDYQYSPISCFDIHFFQLSRSVFVYIGNVLINVHDNTVENIMFNIS